MSFEFAATLLFGLVAFFLLYQAKRRGFFTFSLFPWEVDLRLLQVIGAFAIYFLASYLSLALAVSFLKKQIMNDYLGYSSWLNFSISLSIFFLLAIYLFSLPRRIRSILRRPFERHSLREDFWAAVYSWVLAFPLVLFVSQAIELILKNLFHIIQLPDQLAVKFLKSTFAHPLYFSLAIFSIIILAPLIEETLFRGFLQTYIRRHLGQKQAIWITSVCFSLFHFSFSQGFGNLSIIPSLFIFSLFLGFVYEKQASIYASMMLHGLFNLISVVNLYLFGGFTTGL